MILVFSEDKEIALEGLSEGRRLADELKAPLAAFSAPASDAHDYIRHGADEVYQASIGDSTDRLVEALARIMDEKRPEILMIGGTKIGHEVSARVAQRFRTGSATDCTEVRLEGGEILVKRLTLGGRFESTLRFLTRPAVMTYPARRFEKMGPDHGRKGTVVDLDLSISSPKVEVIEVVRKTIEDARLEDASVIVAAGRGLKKKEDLRMIEGLASALGGAVGCSSPLSADLKWLPEGRQIGLSGKKVRPRLYIAVGISGQMQHLAGIREAGTIIAVNSDPRAPIFAACDYGIVGDLYDVVPKLIEGLKR